jgi:hypothetical protein
LNRRSAHWSRRWRYIDVLRSQRAGLTVIVVLPN